MTLADLPELIGFFSYSREDDVGSANRLTKMRERIHEELRSQLGRRRGNFRVWQDRAAIAEGTLWENEIHAAIAQSVFFVPIVTPTAIKSEHCKTEFDLFLAREKELGRDDLIFPILYIRVPELENEARWRDHPVLGIIGRRQYLNWQHLRHLDMDSREVGSEIERFCRSIHDALEKTWVSPEERRRQDEDLRAQREQEEALKRQQAADARQSAAEDEERRKAEAHARRNEELKAAHEKREQEAALGQQEENHERQAAAKSENADQPKRTPSSSDHIDAQRVSKLEKEIARNEDAMKGCVVAAVILAVIAYLSYEFVWKQPFFTAGGAISWVLFIVCCLLLVLFSVMPVIVFFENAGLKAQLRKVSR